jgi:hypothetical protein
MASPIQNLISIGAAGAQSNHLATAANRVVASSSNLQNSGVQQIIATQAAQGMTGPGKKRITDEREIVDPSFDSEEKEAKSDEDNQEESSEVDSEKRPKRLLDVTA